MPNGPFWTLEEHLLLHRLAAEGLTLSEMAPLLNKTELAVKWQLNRFGLVYKRRPLGPRPREDAADYGFSPSPDQWNKVRFS